MSDSSAGKLWPANVPAEADATRMLLGELPPGEFQSVVESFRASLGPVEKGVLDLRSNQVLVTALAVKWRLTAAIAVAPVNRADVDLAAVDAMVQESQDAVLGLTGGAATVTDFNLKQIFESTKRALNYLSGKLKAAVPKEAPAPAPAPAPEPAPQPAVVEPPPPPPPAPAAIAVAQSSGGNLRFLILAFAVVAIIAAVVHGMRLMQEQSDARARAAKEAKLPLEYKSGKVTQVTLLKPDPARVAALEERARTEGKRLVKISDTVFQLVDDGSAPAPQTPKPEEKAPEGTPPEGAALDASTPMAPPAGEGAKP